MRNRVLAFLIALLLCLGFTPARQSACAQQPTVPQPPSDASKLLEALDKDGAVTLANSGVVVSKYDYVFAGDSVEAIAIRPVADGRYPGLVLIPGFSRSARDYLPLGVRFAKEGFACLAITQRGFGRSTGAPDFVGPKTIAGLEAGLRKFRGEAYVDSTRMGLFGYSRGAMAASLLAVRAKPGELRAAVFAAGIYDFKKAYDEIKSDIIRENMRAEAGLSDAAVEERTSLSKMANLPCPVLILHGEQDENAPVSQAYRLRDKLTELKKDFELKTFPERDHNIGMKELLDNSLEFFKRRLMPEASKS